MEQQKTLWIIFSVALFILVIVGVGVIWFLPSNHAKTQTQTASAQNSTQPKISFDPYEWAKNPDNSYPGLDQTAKPQSGSNFTIIYGQPQSGTPSGGPTVTTQPAAAPQATTSQSAPVATVAPVKPSVTPSRKPSSSSAAARVAQPQRITQHWIQVASYSDDFRAEQAKKNLEDNGITSLIVSHEEHGTTYFRVRVGPYATEQEAEQLLTEVKKIDGFQNSYISLVYAAR